VQGALGPEARGVRRALQGDWANRTVALSSLRGYAAGFASAAGTLLLVLLAQRGGATAPFAFQMGPFWNHAASRHRPGVFLILFGLYTTLFGRLFLLPALVHRLGRWAGGGWRPCSPASSSSRR